MEELALAVAGDKLVCERDGSVAAEDQTFEKATQARRSKRAVQARKAPPAALSSETPQLRAPRQCPPASCFKRAML